MFVNLSNHSIKNWDKNQLTEAKKFGELIEIPFPLINPYASTLEIAKLADEYLLKILKLKPTHVHIVGEFTFCFKLVQLLKANGIVCLAATTERFSEEIDGKKITIFNFIQFREY